MAVLPAVVEPQTAPRHAPVSDILDAFLTAWVDSHFTRVTYRMHLRRGFAYMGVTDLAELTGLDLARWRSQVVERSGYAPSTQCVALVALRSFLTWARRVGASQLPADLVDVCLRLPKNGTVTPYEVLAPGEGSALLRAARSDRDRALVAVLLGAGLRVNEAAMLDVGDVRRGGDLRYLHVRHGKGRKQRTVPIHDDLGRLLARITVGRAADDPLFVSRRTGARLTRIGCAKVVERLGWEALGRRLNCHGMRHTFAVNSLRFNGGDLHAVSKTLGHASVNTTQRYVDHLGMAELAAKIPPLPEW